ncbi:MAG: flagellar protein FlaG [Lachnospiraceae bacterium]|nr:flagellar protein FlaG [Lachnospiraceae bacterium]
MGLAVSGVNNSISAQQVVQAQPKPEVPVVEAATPDIEIQEISQNGVPAPEKPAKNGENGTEAQGKKSEAEIEAENERIKKAVGDLNKKLDANTEAVFGVHEKTNRVTIKMVDKDTKKVIKEFPPDKTLDMIAKVWELAGIMVDEKG